MYKKSCLYVLLLFLLPGCPVKSCEDGDESNTVDFAHINQSSAPQALPNDPELHDIFYHPRLFDNIVRYLQNPENSINFPQRAMAIIKKGAIFFPEGIRPKGRDAILHLLFSHSPEDILLYAQVLEENRHHQTSLNTKIDLQECITRNILCLPIESLKKPKK